MRLILGSSNQPDAGAGIAAYVKELATQFVRLGIEVHVASPSPKDLKWLTDNGIHHFAISERDDQLASARRLLAYIRAHRMDCVINNDNSLLQSVAPALSCPFIAVGHFGSTSIASLACYQWRWSDYVVAISSDMQRRFVDKFDVPITRCPIIHNGIRDTGFDAGIARRDLNTLYVTYAGGANRFKGADLVLKAVCNNDARWNNVVLNWYGKLPPKIVRQLSNISHVRVHGHVPREALFEGLRTSDVLLFPSRAEGCPMALIEAMSLGVVPIASDGEGAMRWLVTSGLDGYICHLKDWGRQMMDCIIHFKHNPDALAAMKQEARRRFVTDYEISVTAQKLLTLLKYPTVDRLRAPRTIEVLRWHRPARLSLLDRVSFRTGWLRRAGTLETADGNL